MKKAIVAVILAFVVLGACSSSNTKTPKIVVGTDTTTTTGSIATTTTTRWSDPAGDAVKATCQSDAATLSSEWTSLAATLQEAVNSGLSNNSAVVQAAVDAVKRGIVASRSWISDCGSYFPDVAARLTSLMNSLETTIGSLS